MSVFSGQELIETWRGFDEDFYRAELGSSDGGYLIFEDMRLLDYSSSEGFYEFDLLMKRETLESIRDSASRTSVPIEYPSQFCGYIKIRCISEELIVKMATSSEEETMWLNVGQDLRAKRAKLDLDLIDFVLKKGVLKCKVHAMLRMFKYCKSVMPKSAQLEMKLGHMGIVVSGRDFFLSLIKSQGDTWT